MIGFDVSSKGVSFYNNDRLFFSERKTKTSKRKPAFPRLYATLMNSVSVLALEVAGALTPRPARHVARKTGVVYIEGKKTVMDFESGSFV